MTRLVYAWLRSFVLAVLRIARESFSGRLVRISLRLWPELRFPSLLVASLSIACVLAAFNAGQSMFDSLSMRSDRFWGPLAAALVTGLVIVEICAVIALVAFNTALRFAADIGRHRVGALLLMAACCATGIALVSVAGPVEPADMLWPMLAAAMLLWVARWFRLTYREPHHPGFRLFHADLVDARRYLAGAHHG